ncbi:hypothetical protein [Georgenia sp. SYP-B2076]|uniref:hypothetical protein n=1 Tax=Georgenia sp. SYP-B2076 TaxID=2495881 RepID=UPI000F8DEAEA|nr:hypothetical protein [Georgenia sp. SYP-B2076]
MTIDLAVLRTLGEEVGTDSARAYVARYVATLDERIYMLRVALTACHTAQALVALRGLRSESVAVGAWELAEVAASVEPTLRHGNYRPAREALPEILQLAAATSAALTKVVSAPA